MPPKARQTARAKSSGGCPMWWTFPRPISIQFAYMLGLNAFIWCIIIRLPLACAYLIARVLAQAGTQTGQADRKKLYLFHSNCTRLKNLKIEYFVLVV